MVFRQPKSRVWGEEESEQLLFRDFADRWCTEIQGELFHLISDVALHPHSFLIHMVMHFQDGVLGCSVVAKEEGSTPRAFKKKPASRSFQVDWQYQSTRGRAWNQCIWKELPSSLKWGVIWFSPLAYYQDDKIHKLVLYVRGALLYWQYIIYHDIH